MAIDIGELRAILTLQDAFSGPAEKCKESVGAMDKAFNAVTAGAAVFASGITAAAGAVVALGTRGADIADVSGAFESLSQAAGESADVMLGALTKGTLGTISNFDLMQKANSVLGSGMIKSAADMGTLAAGAKLLADRTGKDTAQALDILTSSIEKGKTAGLKQLGVFVDSSTAVDLYAQKVGKSTSDLNDQEKAQALSTATLAALRGELEKAGPATADFGDIVSRGKTAVQNFTDRLAVSVTQSPVVQAGLEGIGRAIDAAMGMTSQDTIKQITDAIGDFAILLVDVGKVGTDVAIAVVRAWDLMKIGFDVVLSGLMTASSAVMGGLAKVFELASNVPGIGDRFAGVASALRETAAAADTMATKYADGARAVIDNVSTQETALMAFRAGLEKVGDAMDEARGAGEQMGEGMKKGAEGVRVLAEGVGLTQAELKRLNDEANAAAAAWLTRQETIDAKNRELQDRMALDVETGLARQLLAIQQKQQTELDGALKLAAGETAIYEEQSAKITAFYGKQTADAVASFAAQAGAAVSCGDTQMQRAQDAVAKALVAYNDLAQSGKATYEELRQAHAAMAAAQEQLDALRKEQAIGHLTDIASAASTVLKSVFAKNKNAAIAAAIIDTSAAIVKTLAQFGWWGIPMAAAMAAQGYAEVNKIRSQAAEGFAEGTPDTAFLDFGRGSLEMLHGREAVVTESQGSSLAAMVEAAIRNGQGTNPAIERHLRNIDAGIANLPQVLRVAMRDGVLQAV